MAFAFAPETDPEDFTPSGEIPFNILQGQISERSCYNILEINNTEGTTYSFNGQYNPKNIIDNNFSTFWIKNLWDFTASLTIELKEINNICRIDIAWHNTTLAAFSISVSIDETVFEPLAAYTDNNIGETLFDRYVIPDADTKYIKLSFPHSFYAMIKELRIFTH